MWVDMAMGRVRVADLKDHLSRYLRQAEAGSEIEVTHRDRPIARILPVRQRRVPVIPPRRDLAALLRRRFPRARWGVPSLELLLEERGRR